jgi:hypothetical protein
VFVVGAGRLPVPGVRASVDFAGGHPTLVADPGVRCTLAGAPCAAPIVLAKGDLIEVDGARVEVAA